jgi:hypothetical protein
MVWVVMRSRVVAVAGAFAGSALLGAVAGLVWAMVAPRAQLQEISQGTAQIVNAETSAFIAADGWFCVISVVCGLLTGAFGYWLAIRRAGPVATAALLAGAVAGGLLMLWIGENIGLSTYNHQLADATAGTTFNASLGLGAKSALVFWPLATGVIIALRELGARRDVPPEPGSLRVLPALHGRLTSPPARRRLPRCACHGVSGLPGCSPAHWAASGSTLRRLGR